MQAESGAVDPGCQHVHTKGCQDTSTWVGSRATWGLVSLALRVVVSTHAFEFHMFYTKLLQSPCALEPKVLLAFGCAKLFLETRGGVVTSILWLRWIRFHHLVLVEPSAGCKRARSHQVCIR